jgi:hypothetical protein
VTKCEQGESVDIEVYFYDELDPVDRARVESHLRGCEPCRRHLEDLRAIRRALALPPAIDAPPAGDWSGFMRRLDESIAGASERSQLPAFAPPKLRPAGPWTRRTLLPLAAMLALVAIGVIAAARFRGAPAAGGVSVNSPRVEASLQDAAAAPGRALREASAEHLERSKLVVLGLAARDPRARSEDWQYERALAGALLTDTRLYRQAAIEGGAADVERVMRDLETVLLEASMSDRRDRAALQRVQRLIAKRDLVVKMQVVAAAGPAGS